MSVSPAVEHLFLRITDAFFKAIPRPIPNLNDILNCKIVSHRGEHDNRIVFENTIPAFEKARKNRVWGIELDVRWTKDDVPVIHHDPDLLRLNHESLVISQTSFKFLRQRFPSIPKLSEIVLRYGKKMHLMIELKKSETQDFKRLKQSLYKELKHLVPIKDYHILSLTPDLFARFDFIPSQACLPVADLNIRHLSQMALEQSYAGVAGHYALIGQHMIKQHRNAGQHIGTGYISSKNVLFREINRGVRWLFSNEAVMLMNIISKYRTDSKPQSNTDD